MKIMPSELKNVGFRLVEELQGKQGLPMLTGRRIARMICAFFEIKEVQGSVTGMND